MRLRALIVLFFGGLLMSAESNLLAVDYLDKKFEEREVKVGEQTFTYRLLKPAKLEPGKEYPVVLFLHGAGERGSDNENQLKYFPRMMATDNCLEKFPCFVIAPQCRKDKMWVNLDWSSKKSIPQAEPTEDMQNAIAALQQVLEDFPTDKHRVYLTGLSMGGYGSWDLAARHPDWFAAVVPICGGGDESQGERLKNVPIWAYHGDNDGAVPVERSRKMIEAIKKAGGSPKYTELPGVGHNSWTPAYSDANGPLPWMFEQSRE